MSSPEMFITGKDLIAIRIEQPGSSLGLRYFFFAENTDHRFSWPHLIWKTNYTHISNL